MRSEAVTNQRRVTSSHRQPIRTRALPCKREKRGHSSFDFRVIIIALTKQTSKLEDFIGECGVFHIAVRVFTDVEYKVFILFWAFVCFVVVVLDTSSVCLEKKNQQRLIE